MHLPSSSLLSGCAARPAEGWTLEDQYGGQVFHTPFKKRAIEAINAARYSRVPLIFANIFVVLCETLLW